MKTILGTLVALGMLTSAASAQMCLPGSGRALIQHPVAAAPAIAEAPAVAPAPIEPAPLPQPAPEAVPPK